MKRIKLYGKRGNGKFALVDDEDYELVNLFRWTVSVDGYVWHSYTIYGKQRLLSMHRLIINTPQGKETDHEDHNKFNNQKFNLRICTTAQNQMNIKIRANRGSSIYKGVYWDKVIKRWVSRVRCHKESFYVGAFKLEKEAAGAYNAIALELFGEFANLNKIER